jgi:hypothetical protein
MILSALLAPFSINSYGKNIETRIKELKEARLQKQLEISSLGETIAKKNEILSAFTEESQYLLRALIKRKKAILEAKNGGITLSSEEEKQLAAELRNSTNEFLCTVYAAYENANNIEGMLVNGFFDEDNPEGNKLFESLKFFLIKSTFERDLVIELVKKYEVCIQELIKINQELDSLKK